MIRTTLKYTCAAIATPLALIGEQMSVIDRDKKERQGYEPRAPLRASEYQVNKLFNKPLRTVLLLIIYQIVFIGGALSALFTEQAWEIFFIFGMVGDGVRGILPAFLIPALPILGVVSGLVFAVIIHPALNAYTEIRMHYA